jgi:hypothetical protein
MTRRTVSLVSLLFALAAPACTVTSRSSAPRSSPMSSAAAAPAPVASVPAGSPAGAAPPMTAAPSDGRAEPRDPAFISTPEPRQRPASHPRGSALGMSKELRDSAVDGLWVWHDERGSEWHLRTSTHGPAHRFSGRVWLSEGSFAGVRPSRTEWSDRLRASGKAIEFDFRSQTGVDGFEFRATGRCVHFALSMDGRRDTDSIHVGASGAHPREHVFTLCP